MNNPNDMSLISEEPQHKEKVKRNSSIVTQRCRSDDNQFSSDQSSQLLLTHAYVRIKLQFLQNNYFSNSLKGSFPSLTCNSRAYNKVSLWVLLQVFILLASLGALEVCHSR